MLSVQWYSNRVAIVRYAGILSRFSVCLISSELYKRDVGMSWGKRCVINLVFFRLIITRNGGCEGQLVDQRDTNQSLRFLQTTTRAWQRHSAQGAAASNYSLRLLCARTSASTVRQAIGLSVVTYKMEQELYMCVLMSNAERHSLLLLAVGQKDLVLRAPVGRDGR